jgi:TRAP-type C4-dicarboxylate transport system substrate-binding protein
MKLAFSAALAASVIVGFAAAKAEDFNLTMASSHPVFLPWVGPLSTRVVAETNARLEAKGSPHRINWTESYAGALYGFNDTLEAVEDGLTDAGWVGTLWEESKMPLQNITYYTPFVSNDLGVQLRVLNQMHENVPALAEAWTRQNQIYLGAAGADTHHLFTTFPVNSLEDLRGRKILAPGLAGAWVAAAGAIPVDGALTTFYNQIQTGVADGGLTIITGAVPNKIPEVAPYVTLVGAGSNFVGAFSMNLDTWNDLPEDVQAVLRELGQEYTRDNVAQIVQRYAAMVGQLRADPKVTVTEMSEEDRAAWAAMMPNLAQVWADQSPDGPAVLKGYMDAIRAAGGTPLRDWDKEVN